MRVPDELERRLADAAQLLMGLAREANALDPEAINATAETMQAASLSVAIQAVFMADLLAQPESVSSLEGDHMLGLYRGLGLGAGNCIGALENPQTRSLAFGMVVGACERGLKARAVDDSADAVRETLHRIFSGGARP